MLDEKTGLPKVLQEGDYFKLRPSSVRPWMELSYMRPRTFWFDLKMEKHTVVVKDGEVLSKEDLYRSAEILLGDVKWLIRQEERRAEERTKGKSREEKARKRAQAKEYRKAKRLSDARRRELQASVEAENRKFYGKYPPKTL